MTEKKINRHNPKGLKLNDVIRLFDPLVRVVVWTDDQDPEDDNEEPAYEGSLLDLPWYFLDYEIGSYDPEWDGAFLFRDSLGEGKGAGIVMCLIAK